MPRRSSLSTLHEIGPYEVHEVLGEGTFGEVKKVQHKETGVEYAIKILNLERIKMERMTEQVKREVAILRKLGHPNIVKLVEVLKNKRHIFLVTELVPGGDLFDRLALDGSYSEAVARNIFRQIVDAVGYCHARGICHRDLKLENILLTENMGVKVADFGFAQALWSESAEEEILLKTLCGTPSYLPPEILKHEKYFGTRVDVWCAGIILYTLVAGSQPFPQPDNEALFAAIVAGDYTVPTEFSESLRDLVSNTVHIDGSARLTVAQIQDHAWMRMRDGDMKAEPSRSALVTVPISEDTVVFNPRR